MPDGEPISPKPEEGGGDALRSAAPSMGTSPDKMVPVTEPRRRRRWFQYSLRTLFVLMTLSAVLIYQGGKWYNEIVDEERAVTELCKHNAQIEFCGGKPGKSPSPSRPPLWFCKLVGKETFQNVDTIDLRTGKAPPENPQMRDTIFGPLPIDHDLDDPPTGLTIDRFKLVMRLNGLRSLVLHADWTISDEMVAGLASLEHLTEIRFRGPRITGYGFNRFQHLRNLSLDCQTIRPNGFAEIGQLTSLQSLSLWSTNVTDADLVKLSGLEQLTDLALAETAVSDAGLAQCANFRKLRGLRLNGTNVAGSGFCYLTKLPLSYLDLSRTKVTNDHIAELAAVTTLEYLDVTDTPVTPSGLDCLKFLPSLKTLRVSGKETSVEYRALRAAFPRTRIGH